MKLLRLIPVLIAMSLPCWAAGPIARTGNCPAAAATSCTFSATATGDLKYIWAYNSGSTTIPTLPAGWTSVLTKTGTSSAARLGCNVSSSGADTASGTWTNATRVVGISYSKTLANAIADCNNSGSYGTISSNGTGTTATYGLPVDAATGAQDIHDTKTGYSWFVGFEGVSAGAGCVPVAMSSVSANGAGPAILANDTNGTNSTWPSTNCTQTSANWITAVIEVAAAPCNHTAYGNLFCEQAQPLASGSCGGAINGVITTTAGRMEIAVLDATSSGTAPTNITDNQGNSWTQTIAGVGFHTIGAPTQAEGVWTTIANSSGALNVTVTCSGVNLEYGFIEVSSSVGTPVVNCHSAMVPLNNVASGSTFTTNCTSTKNNSLDLGVVNWIATFPSVGPGICGGVNTFDSLNLLSSQAVEIFFSGVIATTAGTQTITRCSQSLEDYASANLVISDGASTGCSNKIPLMGAGCQ